jgi:hypothetical protein
MNYPFIKSTHKTQQQKTLNQLGENMAKRRSKKRNYLTMDVELAELAYVLHGNASRLRATVTHINITAAFRMQLLRMEQRMAKLARSLGIELEEPSQEAFVTKESAERVGEQLGLFS